MDPIDEELPDVRIPAWVAGSTVWVRGIGLSFGGFWIALCSSSCDPWLMSKYLITFSDDHLRICESGTSLLGPPHLERLRLRLFSLERERLLWP